MDTLLLAFLANFSHAVKVSGDITAYGTRVERERMNVVSVSNPNLSDLLQTLQGCRCYKNVPAINNWTTFSDL